MTAPVRIGGRRRYDFLVVGAGFAGSVVAERLSTYLDARVLLVDCRPHIGGNAYDHYDDAGILVHRYGPHIFHTTSREVFDYLSRFTEWRSYQHRVLAASTASWCRSPSTWTQSTSSPTSRFSSAELDDYFHSLAEPVSEIRTSEDAIVSKVGRELYEKFFRNYTRKQWGVDPSELDASVTSRIPVRTNRDARYFTDPYQVMPLHGYTRMFERMLDNRNMHIMLNTDYREVRTSFRTTRWSTRDPSMSTSIIGSACCRIVRCDFDIETVDKPGAPARAGGELSQRVRLHARDGVQVPHRPGAPEDQHRLRVSRAPRRSVLPVPQPENAELYRKYEALAPTHPERALRGAPGRPTSTTTWTRSSRRR